MSHIFNHNESPIWSENDAKPSIFEPETHIDTSLQKVNMCKYLLFPIIFNKFYILVSFPMLHSSNDET